MALTREDLKGENIAVTLKPMPTGEIRCRMKPARLLGMRSKAIHLTKTASDFGWQGQFHRHRLQKETYFVVYGRVGMVMWDGVLQSGIYATGDRFSFYPGQWHDICTTPDTEFVTVQLAEGDVDVEKDREVMEILSSEIEAEEATILQLLLV